MKEMLCTLHVQYTCICIHVHNYACVYNIFLRYQCLAGSNCCTVLLQCGTLYCLISALHVSTRGSFCSQYKPLPL